MKSIYLVSSDDALPVVSTTVHEHFTLTLLLNRMVAMEDMGLQTQSDFTLKVFLPREMFVMVMP